MCIPTSTERHTLFSLLILQTSKLIRWIFFFGGGGGESSVVCTRGTSNNSGFYIVILIHKMYLQLHLKRLKWSENIRNQWISSIIILNPATGLDGANDRCIPAKGEPLGVEDGRIPDSSLTSSSNYNSNHVVQNGRLNFESMVQTGKSGAWVADNSDQDKWVKVCHFIYPTLYQIQYVHIRLISALRVDFTSPFDTFTYPCNISMSINIFHLKALFKNVFT